MAKDTLVHLPPEQDKSKLFLVAKVAEATGVSRATILRMEKRGLLTPAYISPNGLRYYDNYNLSRIMEIQRLQAMGFSYEEALMYFSSGGDADAMLTLVEERMRILKWTYEEMKLRASNEYSRNVELVRLDSEDYYVERGLCITAQEKYDFAYNAYHNCAAKGYALSYGPLVLVHECESFLTDGLPDEPYPIASCTPVKPGQHGAEIETFPAGPALVLSFCGDLYQLNDAYLYLGQQMRERGLIPAGYLRSSWVVGPYTGRELGIEKYRARIILPVKEPGE